MLAVEFLTWRASLYNSLSSPVFKLVLARRRTGSMMLQFQINAAAKLLRLRQPVPGTIAVSPDELTATFTTDCSAQSFHQLLYGSYGWDSGPGRPASAVRLYRLHHGHTMNYCNRMWKFSFQSATNVLSLFLIVFAVGTQFLGQDKPLTQWSSPAAQVRGQDNVVIQWNNAAVQTIRYRRPWPTIGARALAIAHTCMYDAWAAY